MAAEKPDGKAIYDRLKKEAAEEKVRSDAAEADRKTRISPPCAPAFRSLAE